MNKKPPNDFDAALFDLDGTIVDTEPVLHRAWTKLVQQNGADFSTFDYSTIIGKPDLEACRIVDAQFNLGKDIDVWFKEYQTIVSELIRHHIELRPHADILLAQFHALGIPIALVTSARNRHAESILKKFGLFGYFSAIITADTPQLTARKPDPAPYILAASLLGTDSKRCIAFEDSSTGVRSAKTAGCFVFALPHQYSPASHLGEADVILTTLADFDLSTISKR